MLKAIALGLAAGIALAGSAPAQPLPPPAAEPASPLVLVKKDKGENGPGRKLGHYKQHGDNEDDNGRWSSQSRTYYVPVPVYPPSYYVAPGYGSSLPPPYYVAPY